MAQRARRVPKQVDTQASFIQKGTNYIISAIYFQVVPPKGL